MLTNLTGHPSVVVSNGFNEAGDLTSISFTGHLYDESIVLSVAKRYQEASSYHLLRPEGYD